MDPREQFSAIYRLEFAFVWAAARRLGVPSPVVEDAVQEVFLTAFRRLDHLRYEVSPRAWLYAVTRRIASRYRRTASRTARRVAAVAHAGRASDDAPQEHLVAVQQIEGLIARLDPRLRVAFEMADLLGMSGPEIAAELGVPMSTVYSRVRLAREHLARELAPQQLEQGLGAARAQDNPPQAAAQRGWLLLLPRLGSSSAGLAALLSVRSAAMTVLLAAGVLVVVAPLRVRGPGDGPRVEAPSPAPGPGAAVRPASPAPSPARSLPADRPVPVVASSERRRSVRIDGLATDRIAAEVALLDRARAALGRDDDHAAGALLAEHLRDFPDGVFIDLRMAIEVELLCSQGLDQEAASRAAALLASHPRSAVAQRLVDFSCPR